MIGRKCPTLGFSLERERRRVECTSNIQAFRGLICTSADFECSRTRTACIPGLRREQKNSVVCGSPRTCSNITKTPEGARLQDPEEETSKPT